MASSYRSIVLHMCTHHNRHIMTCKAASSYRWFQSHRGWLQMPTHQRRWWTREQWCSLWPSTSEEDDHVSSSHTPPVRDHEALCFRHTSPTQTIVHCMDGKCNSPGVLIKNGRCQGISIASSKKCAHLVTSHLYILYIHIHVQPHVHPHIHLHTWTSRERPKL